MRYEHPTFAKTDLDCSTVCMSVDQLIATPDFVALADAIAVNAERLPDSLVIAFGVHEFAAEDFVCVIYEHAEVSCHYANLPRQS